MFNRETILAAHKHSISHLTDIQASDKCGCFYCLTIFSPADIKEWVEEGLGRDPTGLCPNCGIDAVMGSKSGYPVTDTGFLTEMYDYWFSAG